MLLIEPVESTVNHFGLEISAAIPMWESSCMQLDFPMTVPNQIKRLRSAGPAVAGPSALQLEQTSLQPPSWESCEGSAQPNMQRWPACDFANQAAYSTPRAFSAEEPYISETRLF